jgi:hypothetical protein
MNRTPYTLRTLAIALLAVGSAYATTTLAAGEATPDYPQPVRVSTVDRDVVRAEAIAARKLGLISEGELNAPAATPEQLAIIAAAGRAAALKLATR